MSFAWLSGKSARMPWRLLLNSNNSYSLSPRREVVDKQCNISKIKIDWVVFFALFLALLMFVPLIIKADFHLEGSKEDREYRDINCVIAVLCSISALSPLVIDMILDLIYVPTAYATYLYLRTIGLGALLMYDVIYLVALHFKNFTLYAEVADNFEYMVTVSVALLFFRDLDTKECWTNYRIIVLLLIYFSYFVFNVIHLMFPSTFSRYSEWESIPDYLLYAGCLCIYFQWFWRFFNEFKVKNQVICMANVSFKDGYVIILMIPFSMVALFVFVNSRVNAYDTKEYRVNMTVMRTVYMIVIAYLPGRMIRQAANDILLVNETNRLDAEMIKLQSDLRMKRNFVRHVSHEIRTPLSTVFSGLELIAVKLNKLQVSHGVAEVLDDIQDVSSSCDAALLIVNDLLSYEKLDSGLMTLETLTVFAVPFIGKSIAPFRLMSESKGVHIKAYFKDNLQSDDSFLHSYQIDADTNKLVQVVRNLCSNAIKFTPKGGLVQIGLTIDHLNKQLEDGPNEGMLWLRVTFKDSGVGIAPENISKLFGEGIQFDAGKNQGGGGSGMGLWISKQIMELHGGRLTAQSEGIGHGCTFTMEMPINDRGSTENLCHSPPTVLDISGLNKSASYSIDVHTPAPLLSRSLSKVGSFKALTNLPVFKKKVVPSSGESRLNPLNILVCDDSAPARKVLCKLLRSKGHTCLEAMDGAEAVEFLKGSFTDEDCAFNVILMDDQMPNLNGCNASRIIRQLGYIGIIIGITGNALPEEIENFVSFGADQVLPKPVSSELLFFTIHDIMTRKSASNDS